MSAAHISIGSALVFAAVFVFVAFITFRRPILGVSALILLDPFAFYSSIGFTTLTLSKVALVAVIAALFMHGLVRPNWMSKNTRLLLLAFVLVAAAMALSIWHASFLVPALRDVWKWIEYALIFAACAIAYRSDRDETFVRWSFVLVTAAVVTLSLPELAVGATSGIAIGKLAVPRIAGPLEGPNQLASYLGLTLPVLLAYTLLHGRRQLEVFVVVLGCIAAIFTFSRAGSVSLALALCIVGMFCAQSPWVRRLLGIAVLALLAASAAAWQLIAGGPAPLQSHRIHVQGGLGTRRELWDAALRLWRAHPIWGIGAGNFELEVGPFLHAPIRTHANSLYLQTLVEGGIPLFAAMLFLIYRSIATFAGRARTPLAIAALAASVALAYHQILDYLVFYPKVGMQWAILLGIACADLSAQRFDR